MINELAEFALQEEPPEDEDELLVLATWLPRKCSDITNATIQSLVAEGSQPEAVQEAEQLCPLLHQVEVDYTWTFIESLYFSMTVVTTIGYGYHCPVTTAGRIMCMIYAVIGIPLTGMLLALTSDFFGEQLFKLFKAKLDSKKQQSKMIIALFTFIYIAIGFVVFIFIPAVIFMVVEDWSYLNGIYYAFITLTTIGFGDLVTGSEMKGWELYVYQICVILWIVVGLGYWVMVANFITKALKSKRLQSSVLRSAEEMKKLMQQMGIKNHDPRFLRQHSKATVNFMLQLSNIIAVQGGAAENGSLGEDAADSPSTSSPPTSPTSPMGIPGISALFGPGMNRAAPFSQLIGPLSRRVLLLHDDAAASDDAAVEGGYDNQIDGDDLTVEEEDDKASSTVGSGTSASRSPRTSFEDAEDPPGCLVQPGRKTSLESQTTLQLKNVIS
ncbi:potassium channel subfamily K member 1-like isoform X2 [Penaeus japonicus]|uniref:potassium channel subfamily K member 1-like isoform X2 n=1 Tax=Penaeus japonicus TaxID=27405 RepID=UPI001C70C404|nr:potassium channel subfamily K member 1-like isoform X2 [Penaeus japonicus]